MLFFAIATPFVAAAKGRRVWLWFLLGLFLTVPAFVVVAVLPSLKSQRVAFEPSGHRPGNAAHGVRRIGALGTDPERVPCPHCAELILPEAKKCRFCGEMIGVSGVSGAGYAPNWPEG